MRIPLLALLLACLAALPLRAADHKTPEALIAALYSYDTTQTDPDALSLYAPFFSKSLLALFQKDRDSTPEGDMGALDFDPVIAGQDGAASNVTTGVPIVIDDTAELEVDFTNGVPVRLYYTLVREEGGWKVNDIANQQGEYPWGLRAILGEE